MKRFFLYMVLLILAATACIEDKDTEVEQPQIEFLSPLPCDTLNFNQSFRFRVKLNDNTGLGNISMDMHHNFGHHSHGDHETCNMDDPKDAINPFEETWIFSLPDDKKEYIFDTLIYLLGMDNDTIYYDTGDYHFHIYLTDNDGHQVFTSLDVKVSM